MKSRRRGKSCLKGGGASIGRRKGIGGVGVGVGGVNNKMKGSLTSNIHIQLGLKYHHQQQQQQPFNPAATSVSGSSRFQKLLESEAVDQELPDLENVDLILSQDFFCTPDYITPDDHKLLYGFGCNKDNIHCPKSPEKSNTVRVKKRRHCEALVNSPLSPTLSETSVLELSQDQDDLCAIWKDVENTVVDGSRKIPGYVSQSAVALRCRVMPPPCMKNPYLGDASEVDLDPFGNQRSKCSGLFPAIGGGDGLSRYHTDFHEIQQIGMGNFSRVFKVLKRIEGCLYAVKHSTRMLHQDAERRKALMEVQVLAALGRHENIVSYYSSWFENEQLYIQMELCDCSLSINNLSIVFTERKVLEVLYQIANALQFIHERGISHLDVKPENIYVKNGVYKLGDFGCATLLNQSLPIEEGDARYMPQEILNENYDNLEKVDIFSLGASIYELVRGSPLPEPGSKSFSLREGKLPLLPGHSMQFQNLLKAMVDPDPDLRPSAKELLQKPIFKTLKGKR